MLTLPNLISLIRLPLALVFLQENVFYRAVALLLAMASDALDGYIARRYGRTTQVGTLLDPLTDKLFVIFVLCIALNENRLSFGEASTMLCRDFSVILFGIYLAIKGRLGTFRFRAIWCGKITTMCQFGVLLGLTFNIKFPPPLFITFIALGLLALGELYLAQNKLNVQK